MMIIWWQVFHNLAHFLYLFFLIETNFGKKLRGLTTIQSHTPIISEKQQENNDIKQMV